MDKLTKDLAEALGDALQWNWADNTEQPPSHVTAKIKKALAAYRAQLEQEQRDKDFIPY